MRTPEDFSNLVDAYIQSIRGPETTHFLESKRAAQELHKEGISLARNEGEMLGFFTKLFQCRKFIEIGTLTGYSALCILKNLKAGGELWTFEKDSRHAQLSRDIFSRALNETEFQGRSVHVMEGDAEAMLTTIEQEGPFDGIFIDGNKGAYGRYLQWAAKNIRPGGLVICDNVFLGGAVLGEKDPRFSANQVSVVDSVNRATLLGPDFEGVLIPTREGLSLAVRK
jgi:predicted O-methyltransferase YrrM